MEPVSSKTTLYQTLANTPLGTVFYWSVTSEGNYVSNCMIPDVPMGLLHTTGVITTWDGRIDCSGARTTDTGDFTATKCTTAQRESRLRATPR